MGQPELPIIEIRQRLLETLRTQKRLVLTAPTGSGKSTQVPQMLLDGGLLGDGQVNDLAAAPLADAHARDLGRARARRETRRRSRLPDAPRQRHFCRHADPLRDRRRAAPPDVRRSGLEGRRMRSSSTNFTSAISTATSPWRARCNSRNQRGPISSSSSCPRRWMSPSLREISRSLARCCRRGAQLSGRDRISRQARGRLAGLGSGGAELQRLVRKHPEGDVLDLHARRLRDRRTMQAARDALGRAVRRAAVARRTAAGRTGCGRRALRPAQSRRRHQCRRNFADHRRRAAGDRQRPGAHGALRSVPRHQHAAHRKNQPRRRRPARRPRRAAPRRAIACGSGRRRAQRACQPRNCPK